MNAQPKALIASLCTWFAVGIPCLIAMSAHSQEAHVFADGQRVVEMRLRNPGADPLHGEARIQLLQLTSSTAVPVGGLRAWKSVSILPGQTVVEFVPVEFPKVRVSTHFAARCLNAGGKVLGLTEVWAHPDNLLDSLKLLADGRPLGLRDEAGLLRPTLTAHGIAVVDLGSAGSWNGFRGRLAFNVSPPEANQGSPRGEAAILARAKEGLAVVWFQTTPAISTPAPPLVERVNLGKGTIVLAPATTLAGLVQSPAAQLTLLRLAELALSPPAQFLASDP